VDAAVFDNSKRVCKSFATNSALKKFLTRMTLPVYF